jgi:hypothetical protein
MTKFLKPLFILFLTACLNFDGISQEISWKDRLYVETEGHYGFVVPHHNFIAYFITDHVRGFQVNVGLHTNGEKNWQQYYHMPNIGLGFYHSGLGNKEVFGEVNALFCYVERFFLNEDKRFNFGNRISFGLDYINKKYDINQDNFDVAIGSHINVFLNYSLEIKARLSPQLNLKFGAGFSHTSNGNIKSPNKGLNLFTSFVGIQYSFKPWHVQPRLLLTETEESKNKFLLSLAFGKKQVDSYVNKTIIPLAVSGEYGRKVSRTGWLGSSLNIYNDPSIKKKMESLGDTASYADNIRITLNLSYEIFMGRLSYVFQPGIYLKNNYKVNGLISNRIGLRYKLTDHLITGVTIKAHWVAVADFIEFGVGYQWHK